MARIRINKDIAVRWEIATDGVAKSLHGRDLRLVITDPNGNSFTLPFSIENSNTIVFSYYGKDQKVLGNYRATLYENTDKVGMNAVDVSDFVTLVASTEEEIDGMPSNIDTASVELQGDLKAGVQGMSAYEIALAHGFKGTEEQWLKSLDGANGLDGASLIDLRQTKKSTEAGGVNEWTATLADGSTRTMEVRNGSQGPAGSGAPFMVTYGVTTLAEMNAAFNAGLALACLYKGQYYHLMIRSSDSYYLFGSVAYERLWYIENDSDEWIEYKETIGQGGEADSKVFLATYGATSYSAVKAAYDAGKIVVCKDEGRNMVGYLSEKKVITSPITGPHDVFCFTLVAEDGVQYIWSVINFPERGDYGWEIAHEQRSYTSLSQFDNDCGFITEQDLPPVAKTGSYNDLNDKPVIPDGVVVVDNLASTSTTSSLSANQGRALKALIDRKQAELDDQQWEAVTSGITSEMVNRLARFLAGDVDVIKKMSQAQYNALSSEQRARTLCIIV